MPSLTRQQIEETLRSGSPLHLNGQDLQDLDLSGLDLRGSDFSYANLGGVNLRGCNLQAAILWSVRAAGANLSGADLRGANLGTADLSRALLRDALLCRAKLLGTDLTDADLSGADLRDADLRNAILSGTVHNAATQWPSLYTPPPAPGVGSRGPLEREVRTMVLSEQDRGATVEVSVGDLVTVRLTENPTTGYRWQIESTGGLELTSDRFESGGAVGAAGVRVLDFRAATAGAHAIRMKNFPPWEGEGAGVASFEATVVVR